VDRFEAKYCGLMLGYRLDDFRTTVTVIAAESTPSPALLEHSRVVVSPKSGHFEPLVSSKNESKKEINIPELMFGYLECRR
jgi:hypothetical protein